MEELIKNLVGKAEVLKQLFVLSPMKPTPKALLSNRPDQDDISTANNIAGEIDTTIHGIKIVANDLTDMDNRNQLDSKLSYFRSMAKMLDCRDMCWSTSYDDIRKSIKEIHCLLIDIDTKYFLGTHKKNLS